jgi:hypothetical protein
MSEQTNPKGTPVPRDTERFRLLFSNSPANIPEGYKAPLDSRTTLEMMHDRDSKKNSSAQ